MALTFESEIVHFRFIKPRENIFLTFLSKKMAGNKRERENETSGFPSILKKPRRFLMRYVCLYICYSKFWYQKFQGTACMYVKGRSKTFLLLHLYKI